VLKRGPRIAGAGRPPSGLRVRAIDSRLLWSPHAPSPHARRSRRPTGGSDLSSYASGAQRIADAGARLGESVENLGKATYQTGRQQAMTEAVNANAFIHGRLIEARERYRNDPDHATLAQRWNDEAGQIVDDGLSQISDDGLREHVRAKLAVPLAQESAAIEQQAFHGSAAAHAASREKYLRNLVQHSSLDPGDSLFAGGVDSLHAAIDDAAARGFLTPEQAAEEKRRDALELLSGEYARMSRADPQRAIRELETPGSGHPLLPQLPQTVKDSLIARAREQQVNGVKDAEHAALRRAQDSERASDQSESEIVADLTSGRPTLTRAGIADNPLLTKTARARMLALEERTAAPDPDETASNSAARGLLDRIRLRDGDPSRIASPGAVYDAYIGGKLNREDFDFVRKELAARQTPDEAPLLARKQAFLKSVAPAIDGSDPLIGDIDQLGRAKMYLLERDLDRTVGQYAKAGKDPLDLFDPAKPDYAGKPEALERYRTTVREALEDNARRLQPASGAAAAPPPVPPRTPGESPADYLLRTGAPLPQARPHVPVSR
jgi:hypothetical protein